MAKNTQPVEVQAEVVTASDLNAQAADLLQNSLLSTTDPLMEKIKAYYGAQQIEYARRMTEIEAFLGFVESAEGLGRRLERVEQFIGIKG